MNKYLNGPSSLKFNNSEEFKEYQKYKEDLVNKIKNNKKTDNDTNSNVNSNDSINKLKSNRINSNENSFAIKGRLLFLFFFFT